MQAQYTVYRTSKDEGGEIQVEQVAEVMPKRQAQNEAKRLQAEITAPGQLVHTSSAQFYAVNTVSGKILV